MTSDKAERSARMVAKMLGLTYVPGLGCYDDAGECVYVEIPDGRISIDWIPPDVRPHTDHYSFAFWHDGDIHDTVFCDSLMFMKPNEWRREYEQLRQDQPGQQLGS